jgi:hypothetical protein
VKGRFGNHLMLFVILTTTESENPFVDGSIPSLGTREIKPFQLLIQW